MAVDRIVEFRERLREAERRRRGLEAQKLMLAREIYEEMNRVGLWGVIKLAGRCRDKGHGYWCKIRAGRAVFGLDTYNGFIHVWVDGVLAFMGADERTIYMYIDDVGTARRALGLLKRLPSELGELAKIASEALYIGDRKLAREAIEEMRRLLGVASDGA